MVVERTGDSWVRRRALPQFFTSRRLGLAHLIVSWLETGNPGTTARRTLLLVGTLRDVRTYTSDESDASMDP